MKSWLLALVALAAVVSGSQTPSANQYHIQTDEGPERYFRFQTDSGQFRKEKRLQDGTVIGTEAWIDAAGYLRQKDYIADKEGYRILKSKTIYVGLGRAVEDAIKSTKAAPAQSGVLVHGGSSGSSANSLGSYQRPNYGYISSTTSTTTPAPVQSSLLDIVDSGVGKLNYLPPEQAAKILPQSQLGFDHYPDELPRASGQLLSPLPATPLNPLVDIHPNAEPVQDLELNAINVYDAEADRSFGHGQFGSVISSTTARPPSLDMLPPLSAHRRRLRPRPTPAPIAIVSSTPAPISGGDLYGYSSPQPFVAPAPYQFAPPASSSSTGYGYYPPPQSPLEVNSLEAALLPPLPSAHGYRRRLRPRPVQGNHLEGLAASEYDGVGTTRNGFRYVLPKQYHEEETNPADGKRAGSFGYVDPFGIRRVVYYNAAPGRGFVHRNNNQFVGANGAPYDAPGPAQLVNE
ncbi:helicase SRCAP [Drosophila elegans]|uniref:helicase SRCAP n=1 Tax=Drosophila elegans TaxID=30023 RepID=UPI0007E87768|nr:helicase SRCAP [Drosophila elegans]